MSLQNKAHSFNINSMSKLKMNDNEQRKKIYISVFILVYHEIVPFSLSSNPETAKFIDYSSYFGGIESGLRLLFAHSHN